MGLKNVFEGSSMILPILNQIRSKFVFRPNGIDSFWLSHISSNPKLGHTVLYIGDFTPNKNVNRLINAIELLRDSTSYQDTKLIIVGGGRDSHDSVMKMISKHRDFIDFKGKIYDKSVLMQVMKQCSVFAMPSIRETFGLVYLESLSQNLPVVYTRNQGIDGLFDDTIGIAVKAESVRDICNAICRIFENQSYYNNKHVDFELFDWKIISESYYNDYKSIIG